MEAKPLVSVIMPCHNAERWVGEAIESCLNQTYPNVEVIVVDDGSTDGSGDVIRRFALASQEKIKHLSQTRAGSNSARNAGMRASCGDYLLFLDSDDLLFPNSVQNLMNCLTQNGTDSAAGDWIN